MSVRKSLSESFFRFIDYIPLKRRYQLAQTPLIKFYRSLSRKLGSPVGDGYYTIVSGPLKARELYFGFENVQGYPSIREYIQGTYKPLAVRKIMEYCLPDTTVMDIGAHYGYITMLMATLIGKEGQCIAFEANRSNYEKILKTKEKNQILNLKVENLAISDQTGNVNFTDNVNSLMGRIVDSSVDDISVEKIETVPASTIDEYVDHHQITNLSFIKMDIEGAERKAITGGYRTITTQRPILLIEVHTFIPPGEFARPLIFDLNNIGYQVFDLSNDEVVDPSIFHGGHILAKYNENPVSG